MRDRGEYASGRRLELAPRLFLGATANPFVPPYAERVSNLQRKIDAGAQFIQTQFCFDLKLLEAFMREVRARGLHERAAIIVGVGTLGSAKALRWMAEHVPGVHVPESVTARIGAAADQRREGRRVCVETIHAVRQIEGVAGVHLMGHKNEDALAQVIVEAALRTATPRLVLAGEMLDTVGAIAKPLIKLSGGTAAAKLGKVLIGTVHGDLHDIGKNIVTFMLDINGFEVKDIGVDVPAQKFIDEIKAYEPDVVGLSGFLTLAFDSMKETIGAFESAGMRKDFKIMIGGGQIDETVRSYTGADAFGVNAVEAVALCRNWIRVTA